MKANKLIAYAGDFVSFLIESIGDLTRIKQVILFGSVARGESTKESDVDIFIDADEKLESEVQQVTEKFRESRKVTKYWELFGVNNEIKCIVGELEKWELKRSIISSGIVLYGRYNGEPSSVGYTMFRVQIGDKRSEQIRLWRALYGYKQNVNGKVYASVGLVKECGGKRLANSIFVVPLQHSKQVLDFLRKNKLKYELTEIWSDML